MKRELNQTHLQQLSQTHLSHLIEALNQLAKRGAQFCERLEEVGIVLQLSHYMKSTPIWPIGIVQPTH